MIGKIVAGVIGGILVGFLGMILVVVAFTPEAGSRVGGFSFFAFWGFALLLSFTASRGAKAWRRVFIACGVISFSLPLASLIFSGTQIVDAAVTDNADAAQVVGAAVGSGMITAISGFLGFFLGIVFMIVGLMVGKDKQIVVVQQAENEK